MSERTDRAGAQAGRGRQNVLVAETRRESPTVRVKARQAASLVAAWLVATTGYAVGVRYIPLFGQTDGEVTFPNALFWGAIVAAAAPAIRIAVQRRSSD
jgi:hypothetical protein